MPLDTLMYRPLFSQREFFRRANWRLKFSLWPRRSFFSKKRIWLTYAYRGTAMWTGPGDPVYEHKWVSKEEFMISKLQGL